tara:strand:- start:24418 stop:24693 length:276 start_codon:yes stop_codon:yes gene_type:complete
MDNNEYAERVREFTNQLRLKHVGRRLAVYDMIDDVVERATARDNEPDLEGCDPIHAYNAGHAAGIKYVLNELAELDYTNLGVLTGISNKKA